jgi:hypothetical protein
MESAHDTSYVVRVGNIVLGSTEPGVAVELGVLLIGIMSARRLGRFNGGNSPVDA